MQALLQRIRRLVPLMVGTGIFILMLDVVILVYRVIGLEKSFAIYAAILTFIGCSYLLTRHYFQKKAIAKSQSNNLTTQVDDD